MARKSRKHPELVVSVSKDTVGYIRLSVLNRDRHGSVENQRLMIEEWGQQHQIPIMRYYIDNGFSGKRFDRPAFQEMLQDIQQGEIDCVVVKDLSRLGRDYITVGYYLEMFFPSNNIRFVSINDQFDTTDGITNRDKSKVVVDKNGKIVDIPVEECHKWSKEVYPIFAGAFQSGKKQEENLKDIFDQIESIAKPEDALLIPPITLEVQVDYDKDRDDIRCFADYIMEFSPENTSFYFIYRYEINRQAFRKAVDAAYEKLHTRFRELTGDADEDQRMTYVIREMLIDLYASACEETVWFADHNYRNAVKMEVSAFKGLFHYQHIVAGRNLADESSDKAGLLGRDMIYIAEQEDQWKTLMRELPDKIVQPIQGLRIQEKVREASVESLNRAIGEISKTNGGARGKHCNRYGCFRGCYQFFA